MSSIPSFIHKNLLVLAIPLILASSLNLFLISDMDTPQFAHQEFWLVWLIAMVTLVWPLTLLEVALVKRNASFPLKAIAALTREADSKTFYRGFVWLAVAVLVVLAGSSALYITAQLKQLYPAVFMFGALPLFTLVVVVAMLLSLFPRFALLFGLIAVFLYDGGQGLSSHSHWVMQPLTLETSAKAVAFALVCNGIGLGVIWSSVAWLSVDDQYLMSSATPRFSIGVFVAQLLAGGLVALMTQTTQSQFAQTLSIVLALSCSAYLFFLVAKNASAHQLNAVKQTAAVVVLLAAVYSPLHAYLFPAVPVLVLLSVLGLCVFAGWKMKISHLRKAIGFSSELSYNLWRICIRIVIPLVFVWLIAVEVMGWFA